ncbi:hypothetical protein [uncultured Halomonas sp.]|uniref:hypothetical protein n=1 Tax=uncultured Halomonas sp. TaxID=173971 RepID=UPI00345767AF
MIALLAMVPLRTKGSIVICSGTSRTWFGTTTSASTKSLTSGMLERFNGRISDVLATRLYPSGEDLEQTLKRYFCMYNHHVQQKAMHHHSPTATMKEWRAKRPELFTKADSQSHGNRHLEKGKK